MLRPQVGRSVNEYRPAGVNVGNAITAVSNTASRSLVPVSNISGATGRQVSFPASAQDNLRQQTRSNIPMQTNVCGSPEFEGMSEVVIKLIAQSAAATSTIQSISEASKNSTDDRRKNALRTIVPVLPQAVQGASTFGGWEVDLGNTFPDQRVLSMEVGGWTLPASQWTVESDRTNIAVNYGTYFDTNRRFVRLVLAGGISGVPERTYDIYMPLQKADCFTVERLLDDDGMPSKVIRFYFPVGISSYIRSAIDVFRTQIGGFFTLQGLRGTERNFILFSENIQNNSYFDTYIDYFSPLLDDFIDALGLWIETPEGQVIMKPRVFGSTVLPQCVLAAPAVPSAYQLANLVTDLVSEALLDPESPNADLAGQFSFAMNYRETADRFSFNFGVVIETNDPVNKARPYNGAPTPLFRFTGDTLVEEMGFGRVVLMNMNFGKQSQPRAGSQENIAQSQRLNAPQSFYRVRPGVYPDGKLLSAAVNDAFDAVWFGPENSSPEDGNAPAFVLTFRKSNGQNVYARVRSGRYRPEDLAIAVQGAVRKAFVCDEPFPCPDADCELAFLFEVYPIFINANLFAGLAFVAIEPDFGESITFEMRFEDETTTINPQSIGYQRRPYTGSNIYCPDACGSQPEVLAQIGVNRGLLQIQTTFANPIAQEFLNVRRIPTFPLGLPGQQLSPFRLRTVFDEARRHMNIESIALPPMHNCLVLCENEESAALLLETPIAHGIPPGTVITLNVSGGAQYTGRSGVTPGVALASLDQIMKTSNELLTLWSTALNLITNLVTYDPDAAANTDAWNQLIASITYGFQSVQGYTRWSARIKPYLRNFTVPLSSQVRLACFFYDSAMIPIALNISRAETEMSTANFASPNTFTQQAQEIVCQTLQIAADLMYAPVYPTGSKQQNLCYHMFVTLQAVFAFAAIDQAAVRTNAVVIEEPLYNGNVDASLKSLLKIRPDSLGYSRAGIAMSGGYNALQALEAVVMSAHNKSHTDESLGAAYSDADIARRLAAEAESIYDVCKYLGDSFYQCTDRGGDVTADATQPAAFTSSSPSDSLRIRRTHKGRSSRKGQDASSSKAFGKKGAGVEDKVTDATTTDRASTSVPGPTSRVATAEAKSNMDQGVGVSMFGQTKIQAALAKAADVYRKQHNRHNRVKNTLSCGFTSVPCAKRPSAQNDPEFVDVANFDIDQIESDSTRASFNDALLSLTDVAGSRSLALEWILKLARSFGFKMACEAATNKARCLGAAVAANRNGVYDCSNGVGICPPYPDPTVTERAFDCIDSDKAPYIGTTGDTLCQIDGSGDVPVDALVPRTARLLVIVGVNPTIPGTCPSWPFREKFNTNVRIIPSCNDIYEVNFRDPPPKLSVPGDGPAVANALYPAVLGFEPVPCFSFGYRVLSAPNVVTLTGYPYALLDVSIVQSTDIFANGGYGGLIDYPGKGSIVTPQRVLTQAVFFGSVAAGEMDKRLVVPMDRITKVQKVVVRILAPDGRPINFHGQNATVMLRLVTLGHVPSACA